MSSPSQLGPCPMGQMDSTLLSSHMTILEPGLMFRVKYFGNEEIVQCSLCGDSEMVMFLKKGSCTQIQT